MLHVWLLCFVSRVSAVLTGNLMACLGVLLFIYASNVWAVMIINVYN